jgi:hypothetical protein
MCSANRGEVSGKLKESMDKLGQMAEDILNSVTVIYGLFQLLSVQNPDYVNVVDEEVRKIVFVLRENILTKK